MWTAPELTLTCAMATWRAASSESATIRRGRLGNEQRHAAGSDGVVDQAVLHGLVAADRPTERLALAGVGDRAFDHSLDPGQGIGREEEAVEADGAGGRRETLRLTHINGHVVTRAGDVEAMRRRDDRPGRGFREEQQLVRIPVEQQQCVSV